MCQTHLLCWPIYIHVPSSQKLPAACSRTGCLLPATLPQAISCPPVSVPQDQSFHCAGQNSLKEAVPSRLQHLYLRWTEAMCVWPAVLLSPSQRWAPGPILWRPRYAGSELPSNRGEAWRAAACSGLPSRPALGQRSRVLALPRHLRQWGRRDERRSCTYRLATSTWPWLVLQPTWHPTWRRVAAWACPTATRFTFTITFVWGGLTRVSEQKNET